MEKIVIIAEVGECFNGDMDTARELIRLSAEAGCDIVKFQTLDNENIADDDPERDWFYQIALDPEKIRQLVSYAREVGIEILFTPENIKTADWLLHEGLNSVKIASSSVGDQEFIDYVNTHFETVFVSTGMATLDEVNETVERLCSVKKLYVMHCVSEYPTGPLLEQRGLAALAPENVHLNMMRILMKLFPDHIIGYSDHTDDILAPVAAAAMGARVIEKHITMDRKTPMDSFHNGGPYMGTDHVLSIEPPLLMEMVRQIRTVEKMIGPWKWQRTEGEELLRSFLRGRFAEAGE